MPVYIEKSGDLVGCNHSETTNKWTRKDRATQPLDHGKLRWAICAEHHPGKSFDPLPPKNRKMSIQTWKKVHIFHIFALLSKIFAGFSVSSAAASLVLFFLFGWKTSRNSITSKVLEIFVIIFIFFAIKSHLVSSVFAFFIVNLYFKVRKQFGDSLHKVVEDKDLHRHLDRLLYLPSQPHFPVDCPQILQDHLCPYLNFYRFFSLPS